jgi:hypothetical protein
MLPIARPTDAYSLIGEEIHGEEWNLLLLPLKYIVQQAMIRCAASLPQLSSTTFPVSCYNKFANPQGLPIQFS